MSQTLAAQCPIPTLIFYEDYYRNISGQLQDTFAAIGLLGGLYGVLTTLSIYSVYALIRRGKRARCSAIVLCLMILGLFASTTTYVVVFVLSHQSDFLRAFIMSGQALWLPHGGPVVNYPVEGPLGLVRDYSELEVCVGTTALAINIALGDGIVCWRVSAVWHHNRAVRVVCAVLILAMLALGIFSFTLGCHPGGLSYSNGIFALTSDPASLRTVYEGILVGVTSCVLSLSTNLVATLLVGYKAWESRKRLRGCLVVGSQVGKVLLLLFESGAVYCAIWGTVLAFQTSLYELWNTPQLSPKSPAERRFLDIYAIFMNGALVPVIAIYPAIIIVLVALNRSHIEKGLTPRLETLPTPNIAVTFDAKTTSIHDDASCGHSVVLVIDGRGLQCGDGEDSESDTQTEKVERFYVNPSESSPIPC